MEEPSHSDSCTWACFRQNLLLETRYQDAPLLFYRADKDYTVRLHGVFLKPVCKLFSIERNDSLFS